MMDLITVIHLKPSRSYNAPFPLSTLEVECYSFAIISAQLVTKSSVWDHSNRKEDVEEILYLVKRGGAPPCRPSLPPSGEIEANSSMLADELLKTQMPFEETWTPKRIVSNEANMLGGW
ncbi:hypothetical protein KIN20_008716 [Parelaphostrongylus tenuis]|uniref:Uncharacterized protein n=1 Tax=Parelaphostrongylus tenuis TaxID=148309 RepID=A0AAD5QKR8_PARTN|nr:hypothetical protein KIN20_008716 [Parelaphostrongylus tenuis]